MGYKHNYLDSGWTARITEESIIVNIIDTGQVENSSTWPVLLNLFVF